MAESLLDSCHPNPEPGLHRSEGSRDAGGNLGLSEPLKECKLYTNPLVQRQLSQNAQESLVALGGFQPGSLNGRSHPRCFFILLGHRLFAPGALMPQAVKTTGARNHQEPAPNRASLWTVQTGLPPDLKKDFLENIFRETSTAQNSD